MVSKKYIQSAFVAACIAEVLCTTYFLQVSNLTGFFSVVFFIAGLCTAIMVLFFPPKMKNGITGPNPAAFLFKTALIAGTAFFLFYESRILFAENPIDYRNADMLPVIKAMNERFLHGNWGKVYESIPGIWSGSKPIYLPFMWLPFLPGVAFDFDIRWITVAAVFVVIIILIRAFQGKGFKLFPLLVLITSFALLWWLLWQDDRHGFFSLTEEGVVVLFYVTLTLSLLSENIFFISIAVCLCMLSRYSAIGFVPAFFFYLLWCRKKNQAILFAFTGILALFLFLIVPFGWKSFITLFQLPGNYINFSTVVWKDSPEVFQAGLGFARFFMPEKIHTLHFLLISLSLVVPSGFVVFCCAIRKKIQINNIPLATLKISMVVFYSFIDVPYLYLFYTSVFVSLTMAMYLLRRDLGWV